MKALFLICLLIFITSSDASQESTEPLPSNMAEIDDVSTLLEFSLEELLMMDIYTPSRNAKSILKTPGVVSVITDEDIKIRGYKTLYELLDEIPGFYNTGVAAWGLTTNRGVAGDNNAGYLFLVDGHSLSNPLRLGVNEEYRFPLLANVKRVEVIRGASSTLWGSYATKGIIHIFTKNANELNPDVEDAKTVVSYDYESAHKRHSVDLLFGQTFAEKRELMLSFNYSDSDAPWTDGYLAGENGLYQPSWMWFRYNQWDYEPSADLYAKYTDNDLTVHLRANQHDFMYPVGTSFNRDTIARSENRFFYTDIQYKPRLTDYLDLESRLFYDYRYNLIDKMAQTTNGSDLNEKGYDNKIGTEHILKFHQDRNSLLLGMYAQANQYRYTSAKVFEGDEQNIALFANGTYGGIEHFILSAGVRFDNSFGRVNTDYVLPSFSAIYYHDNWSVKYDYSTGVSRMGNTFAGIDNPRINENGLEYSIYTEEALQSQINNLQFLYNDHRTYAGVTFYYQKVENLNGFIGSDANLSFQGLPVVYGVWDLGHVTSRGVEFEFSNRVSDTVKLYGNAAYQHSTWEDTGFLNNSDLVDNTNGTTTVPEYTWNLGLDYKYSRYFTFNTKYRGWDNMKYITQVSNSGVKTIDLRGPEHYVDINFIYFGPYQTEFSIYVKNLFDNDSPLAHINSGTLEQPLRRQTGFNIRASF